MGLALLAGVPAQSQDRTTAKLPPREALNTMLRYIRDQPELKFDTTMRLSGVIDRRADFRFQLRQPNLVKVSLKEGKRTTIYVSDGKLMTIYRPAENRHVSVRARGTLIETMNLAAGLTSVMGRVLQFLLVADLADQHSGVTTLAPIRVKNTECTGVRLDRFEEVFDVWIRSSGAPLPCKLVSLRTDGAGRIIQTNLFTWLEASPSADDTFKFVPGNSSNLPPPDALQAGSK
jgi:hypothetical protein